MKYTATQVSSSSSFLFSTISSCVADYYNYDYFGAFDFSRYPVGRFSNEFGFHSMPSTQSWLQAIDHTDLDLSSTTVRLRNHHYPPGGLDTSNFAAADRGMEEMTGAAKFYYPIPNNTDPVANFTAWCHMTQIFQADYYSSQIQYYRRGSGMPERQLGSLYWQLEDQWQAPTWAGIEYDGRWKVLHYAAKDQYQNVIISPFWAEEHDILDVYVTSDLWEPASGSASFTWYDWSGKKVNVSTVPSVKVEVGAINTTQVLHINTTEVLKGFDLANLVLHMETRVRGKLPNLEETKEFYHQNWFQPGKLAQAKIVDPGLKLTHLPSTKKFRVEATKGLAPWVWLDYPAGTLVHFDHNGFWLRAGESVEIGYTVYPEVDRTNGTWVNSVTAWSLGR
jgi:beta-mannosidase